MKKEIIRNKCVSFCSSNYYSLEKNIKMDPILVLREKILNDVCGETKNYEELNSLYVIAKEHFIDNELFISVDRINKNYAIKINEKITIYHFSKRTSFVFLEWQYPSSYAIIGNPNKHTKKEIVSDFLNNSYLHFYFKYVLNEPKSLNFASDIKKENEFTYVLNNKLKIVFDKEGHVLLENGKDKKMYVCDSWWSNNEEVIADLISMPMIEFGNYYKAFWVS